MNESNSLELYFLVFKFVEKKLTWCDGGNYRSFGSRNLSSRIFRTSICGDVTWTSSLNVTALDSEASACCNHQRSVLCHVRYTQSNTSVTGLFCWSVLFSSFVFLLLSFSLCCPFSLTSTSSEIPRRHDMIGVISWRHDLTSLFSPI
jgi:hypothetical protein